MSTKITLALGVVALFAYIGVSYGIRQRFPLTEVAADTALKGRVSGVFQVQSTHFFFLNDKTTTRYDFDDFAPVPGQELLRQDGSLGEYLHVGDSISKRPHSVELTVQRGERLSRWVCPPAANGQ
ncbi:hypothetical protein KB206_17765 [Microvirga sp. STS02]|uniref:hypothetical protein n=1 Tax=Hymenobacter negativus TaxID=2795026 RepID=UPI0018DDCBB7|nr:MULTISPECIES: hypothetical protein [Bacteria]MBH8570745.1 hypothetical protein [Hymenobacter negativus]MBR7210482.1 hypothetical protein [Microvirga sp. STS02]